MGIKMLQRAWRLQVVITGETSKRVIALKMGSRESRFSDRLVMK
jgi:hypothetical protein